MKQVKQRSLEEKQKHVNAWENLRSTKGMRPEEAAKALGFKVADIYNFRAFIREKTGTTATPKAKVITYNGSTPVKTTRTYNKVKTPLQNPLALVIGSPEQLNQFLRGMNQ